MDGIQYTSGAIDVIQTEVGIARRSGTVYSYEYNLTDHLGNVRYTFNKNSSTGAITRVQSDDYYPFGLRKSTGSPVSLNNKYLYNGKELQEEFGQYDYGARFYDPVVGRWNVVDPLAEDYDEFSPYNYTLNNPTNNTDPDGMSVDTPVDIRNDYHFDADGKLNKVVIKPGPDHFYQTDKEGKTSELNSKQLTPDMAGQYLYSSGSLSQDGTLLNEVIINGRRQTSPLPKPTLIEFPSYAGGKALFSGIPRMLELGVDIMRGSENLSQLLVYMKGERNQAGSAGGTNNPFKKLKPDPNKPGNVIENRPDGKTVSKRAPEGFKKYWNDKHPDKPI